MPTFTITTTTHHFMANTLTDVFRLWKDYYVEGTETVSVNRLG